MRRLIAGSRCLCHRSLVPEPARRFAAAIRERPNRFVTLRYDTAVAEICAAPGCAEVVARAATGRPAVFCSAACRVRAHRARRLKAAEPVEVEVDMGSATSRGRLLEQAWMARLRRGQRSVIVAVGLRRPAADRLAGQIADLLDTGQP